VINMTGAVKVNVATLDDLLAIPEETRRHEIIDGELVQKATPSGPHGMAQVAVSQQLGPYSRRSGGRWPGGWRFASEAEVQFADDQIFLPDICGWHRERMERMPSAVPITIRPDWVCEILSTNRHHDLRKKKRAYHRHQVGHYWIIDPVEETFTVHRWSPDGYIEVVTSDREDRVRAEPFDAFELRVAVLFDGPDDDDDDDVVVIW
jgi:Uma2 family endonuclease